MRERKRRVALALSAAGLATLLLAAAAAREVTVEELGAGRYRLTVLYRRGAAPMEQARKQVLLMEEARRLCRGRGRAVSEGALELNQVSRRRLSLSEIYTCSPSNTR